MFARLTISAAVLAALCGPLLAEGRPDARKMTCGQVHEMIDQRGAVVMTTGTHTFDRYIAWNGFCSIGERPVMDTIQTRDTNQCRVYRCQIDDRGDDWLFNRF